MRALAALVGLVTLFLVSWPLPVLPLAELPGSPFGEVDNHFWFPWIAARRLAGHPGPWTNLPAGWEIPMMDPVNLPFALVGGLAGPTGAYRAVLVANLALAGLGGWMFARELSGSDRAAIVGMVATIAAPFLAGVIDFGITESWPIGWLGIHAALVLRHAATRSAASLVGAGLALAAFLASGWYHATFAVPVEIGLIGWGARRAGGDWARVGAGLVCVAALAGASRVPALLDHLAHRHLWEARFAGLSAATDLADWRDNPTFGVDALAFVLPHPTALPVSRTVYLGLPTLALAVLGARRGGRMPLVLSAVLLSIAVGHWLRVAGQVGPIPIRMPAGLLVAAIPAFEGISHWYRATGPAVVFLAAAAAVGARPLVQRGPPGLVAVLIAAVIVGDALYASPTAWPRRHYAVDPPAELVELATDPALPEGGGLLQLPIDDVGAPPPSRSRRPYNQWQPFHGRPVAENYEGPDEAFRVTPVVAVLNGLCGAPVPRGTARDLPPDLSGALADLRRAGFAWVIVHPELARTPEPCVGALRKRLGEPAVETSRTLAWPIPAPDPGR